MVEPTATGSGERVMDVRVETTTKQVSDDGRSWRALDFQPMASEMVQVEDRVDIYDRAGGSLRPLVLSYPVKLENPDKLVITLTPVEGQALISAVELMSIE